MEDHYYLGFHAVARIKKSCEEAEGAGYLPRQGRMMAMIIPSTLKPENVKRLVEIQNRLYIIEMADRMTREEQDERRALIAEREKIRGEKRWTRKL